jgi:hypothetical protein
MRIVRCLPLFAEVLSSVRDFPLSVRFDIKVGEERQQDDAVQNE